MYHKFALLKRASLRVSDKSQIEEFISTHPYIADFCRFMALKEKNGGKEWLSWTETDADEDILFAWQFIEYEFFTQWAKIKEYANSKGVSIIGDIPIYVSDDSCDVWENRSLFQIDENGYPTRVAGVPPDYFAEDGQL